MEGDKKQLLLVDPRDINNISFSSILINSIKKEKGSNIDICIADIGEKIYSVVNENKKDYSREIMDSLTRNEPDNKIRIYKESDIENIGNATILLGTIYNREFFLNLNVPKEKVMQIMVYYTFKLSTILSDNFDVVYSKDAMILNNMLNNFKNNGPFSGRTTRYPQDIAGIDQIVDMNIERLKLAIDKDISYEQLKKKIYSLPTDNNSIGPLIDFWKILSKQQNNNRDGKYKELKDNIIERLKEIIRKVNDEINNKRNINHNAIEEVNINFNKRFFEILKAFNF